MAQQLIDIGTVANDGTGDKPRPAAIKINDNFTELYDGKLESIQAGTNITIDDTDPLNPIISSSGGGGSVESVTGDGVDNTDPDNPVIDLSSYATTTNLTDAINEVITYAFRDETDSCTLALADFETPSYLRLTKTGTATVTIPLNASIAIPVGRAIIVKKVGTGDITYAIGGGGTIVPSNGEYTSSPNQQIVLLKEGTDTWGLYNGIAIDSESLGLVPDTRQVAGIALDADVTVTGLMSAVSSNNMKILPSNVVNDDATPNTLADVTGLSFPVTSGVTYWFRFRIAYTSAVSSTGSRWTINGPAAPTFLQYEVDQGLTASSRTITAAVVAYDGGAPNATTQTAGGAVNRALIEGVITPSANGTVIARFSSEIASSAITALGDYSFVEWKVIENKP